LIRRLASVAVMAMMTSASVARRDVYAKAFAMF
jgi:hypothetical protein